MKKDQCHFSGLPIHPGHGRRFVPTVVQSTKPVLPFFTEKCAVLHKAKKQSRVIPWTQQFRRVHKKNKLTEEQIRKRVRKIKRVERAVAGVELEVIQQRRANKNETLAKHREAALKEAKARKEKQAAQKKARAAAGGGKQQQHHQQGKMKMPKGKGAAASTGR
eukprot:NODE_2256_length_612_cov_105.911340_g2206_i0.p1 GENE.NODE_2256_length_612_cov_105.911340_g2206_i0~~NODE_2256_length_612_cov_105.911340_g2206_i0.p1  ORF type:complete len:163 (+),score=53.27 NODE_2256_length_612_cov_105.911340_g2206_i0:64-552(+)